MEAPNRLADSIAELFGRVGVRRRYPGRSYLFHDGDDAASVFLVESGALAIERTTVSGRQVLFDVATPGDLVGELSVVLDDVRSGTAATLVESRLSVVTATEFDRNLRADPRLAHDVLQRVAGRLRDLSDQYVEATKARAASRIASRLIKLADIAGAGDDGGEPIELEMPLSQVQLAQWAGLSREGAVKGLGELRTAGLIETSRRRIVVLDPAGLRRVARQGS